MGERRGGRRKGTKNRATIERENLISRASRPLGKDVLAEAMNPDTDLDKLDLFFTPLDTFSFYKSLDLLVKGQLAAPPRPFQSEWDG